MGSVAHFEFHLSLPGDRRFAPMLRDLAVQGARHAGIDDAEAVAFGRRVEAAAGDTLTASESAASVPVIVRCSGGPVEVTIGSCCVSTTR